VDTFAPARQGLSQVVLGRGRVGLGGHTRDALEKGSGGRQDLDGAEGKKTVRQQKSIEP